jgi:hypothetical protein
MPTWSPACPLGAARKRRPWVSAGGPRGNQGGVNDQEGDAMYIGGGVLALIIIILILIWLF